MCGITAVWNNKGNISVSDYHHLFKYAERRGRDGFGMIIYNLTKEKVVYESKTIKSYTDWEDQMVISPLILSGNTLMMASCRACPETEPESTSSDMIQPIVSEGIYLVHNGSVTEETINKIKKTSDYKFKTPVDSEGIIAAYLHFDKDMRMMMEYLSGAFAFVLFDSKTKRLFSVTSFNPLADYAVVHNADSYTYYVHSDPFALSLFQHNDTGKLRSKDPSNLHPYSIIEIDMLTGYQNEYSFVPNFLHPKWSVHRTKTMETKRLALIAASGGIDSSLTAMVMKKVGIDVEMVNFRYGQRGEAAENQAAAEIAREIDTTFHSIDLNPLYHLDIQDPSMLLDIRIPITTGGEQLKSTVAWVAGRNALFATILMAMAEARILSGNYSKVYICAGWAQLSEETSGYPDNSIYFGHALNILKDVGYITGEFIEFLPVLSRLTKTEEWVLGHLLNFPFKLTVSCDNPQRLPSGLIALCSDCGSTKLSMIGAQRAGVKDPRTFYDVVKTGRDTPTLNIFYAPEHTQEGLLQQKDFLVKANRIVQQVRVPHVSYMNALLKECFGHDVRS